MARQTPTQRTVDNTPEEETGQAQPERSALADYIEVNVRVSWFPTQKQVRGVLADAMTQVVDAQAGAASISKRLMSSKHPLVKAANAARGQLEATIARYTIPRIAVMTKALNSEQGFYQKREAGVRLIRKDLLDEFVCLLDGDKAVLAEAVRALYTGLPDIQREEKGKQGGLYREEDYNFDPRDCVAVNLRALPPRDTLADLATLCPRLYEEQKRLFEAERGLTVQAFIEDFTARMTKYIHQFARQLGARKRVSPATDGPYARFNDAELIDLLDSGDKPNIPEGHVAAVLQPAGLSAKEREQLPPMPLEEFESKLRPYKTKDFRKISTETVDHLKTIIDEFFVKTDVFGEYRERVAEQVAGVKTAMQALAGDMDSETIARRVRSSASARGKLESAVAAVGCMLEDGSEVMKAGRRALTRDLGLSLEDL